MRLMSPVTMKMGTIYDVVIEKEHTSQVGVQTDIYGQFAGGATVGRTRRIFHVSIDLVIRPETASDFLLTFVS